MANFIVGEFSLDSTKSEEKLKNIIKSMYKTTLKKKLANCVNQCKKQGTSAKFITEVKFEKYLDIINDFKIRHKLTQFHSGIHDLKIERGRFSCKPLPIEERCCKLCLGMKIQAAEDKTYFLLHCPHYAKQRQQLFEKLTQMHYDLYLLEDSAKFIWLLSQENNNCVHWLGNVILSAMKMRKGPLEIILHTPTSK